MECFLPPPLTEEDLFAFLDGIADATLQAHLAGCPSCKARCDELEQWERSLITKLYRFACPDSQRLADYHSGFLDKATTATVHRHVEGCPRCQQDLRVLVGFLENTDDVPAQQSKALERPASIIRPAAAIWKLQQSAGARSLGVRGTESSAIGQTTFDAEAGSAQLRLEIQATGGEVVLTGALVDVKTNWRYGAVELWRHEMLVGIAPIDEDGEFSFRLMSSEPVDLYAIASNGVTLFKEGLSLLQ
jgi:hypothetical protein